MRSAKDAVSIAQANIWPTWRFLFPRVQQNGLLVHIACIFIHIDQHFGVKPLGGNLEPVEASGLQRKSLSGEGSNRQVLVHDTITDVLLNIGFITSIGVQVCDRLPSVRRVLWLTIHSKLSQDKAT